MMQMVVGSVEVPQVEIPQAVYQGGAACGEVCGGAAGAVSDVQFPATATEQSELTMQNKFAVHVRCSSISILVCFL